MKSDMKSAPTATISGNSTLGTLSGTTYATIQTWTVSSSNTFVNQNFTWILDSDF